MHAHMRVSLQVLIWDMRNVAQPVSATVPDPGAACLNMKTSPIGDCLAVVTGVWGEGNMCSRACCVCVVWIGGGEGEGGATSA